jgi:hypothetical protein
MDANDQLLFITLLYLHRVEKSRKVVNAPSELKSKGWMSSSKTLQLTTSLGSLCRILQLKPAGNNYKRLKERLRRLSSVSLVCSVRGKTIKRTWSASLMHWELDEDIRAGAKRVLKVTFPSIIASAAHKQGMQIHTSHDLDEMLMLSKGAILLNTALSGRVRPGKSMKIDLDTLIGYMQFSSNIELKKQKHILAGVITELVKKTDWKCIEEIDAEEKDTTSYTFIRPIIKREDMNAT